MADSSLADKVTRWKSLAKSLAHRLDEVPHLKKTHAELQAAVAAIETLMVDEDRYNGLLREAVQTRRDTEVLCIDLAGRIVTGVQSVFGKRSPELLQFGIDPLALGGGRRKAEEEEPPPAPEPPSPSG